MTKKREDWIEVNHHVLGKLVFPNDAIGDYKYFGSNPRPYYKTFELFEHYIANESIFLDIGAHFGCISMYYAQKIKNNNWTGEILAFEVNPKVCECLEENLKNNINNVPYRVFGNAVSNIHGEKIKLKAPFIQSGQTWCSYGSFGIDNGGPRSEETYEVETLTIDSLNVKPDIIKVDVEGYEMRVMLGMENTLRTHRPILVFEYNNNSNNDVRGISKFLKDCQYIPKAKTTGGDVLCIPAEKV